MPNSTDFTQRVAQLRSGDATALKQFVEEYEPFIRRAVRRSLTLSGLRTVADSTDICQSVLTTFLLHLAEGEYQISDQSSMENLLVVIARRRMALLVRSQTTLSRDRRRERSLDVTNEPVDATVANPMKIAEVHDIIERARQQLTESERELFDLRRRGLDWDAIAAQQRETAATVRQRLSRGLRRVSLELGLEDVTEKG